MFWPGSIPVTAIQHRFGHLRKKQVVESMVLYGICAHAFQNSPLSEERIPVLASSQNPTLFQRILKCVIHVQLVLRSQDEELVQ